MAEILAYGSTLGSKKIPHLILWVGHIWPYLTNLITQWIKSLTTVIMTSVLYNFLAMLVMISKRLKYSTTEKMTIGNGCQIKGNSPSNLPGHILGSKGNF